MPTASAIGYAIATLSDPTPPSPYGPSPIGYATNTLTDPATVNPYGPSAIGYALNTLVGPSTYGDSHIGFVTNTLNAPHKPVAVLMSDGTLKYTAVRTWDGTRLR